MKKIVFIVAVFYSGIAFSQINLSTPDQQDRWHVGGNIGLSFGNNDYFGFAISPFVGYKITENLEGGVTVGYRYSKQHDYKQNTFNAGPYLNFYPINSLFLRTHYEYYTGNQSFDNNPQTFNFDENALWIGGGYRSGGRVKVYIGAMYNVLYKKDESIFSSAFRPIVGVSIGI